MHHVICTDGSKGTWDPSADLVSLVAVRQDEQRAACSALGTRGELIFLGWVDGEVEPGPAAVSAMAREVRRLKPDVVLTHDPWKRCRLHPDHRNVGWIVLDSVVAARDPHFFPEHGLRPHRPEALLLFEADEPDHAEALTLGQAATKVEALLQHRSQLLSTMGIRDPADPSELESFRRRVFEELAGTGARYGVAFAEQFKVLTGI